ncbi:MAG: extracellular solute-binding protein [Treponema sp.]|jgi:putative aldouronate transport system substrate-binding protein|nr:extracellular solute-binding protein [Treponema sp.]
MKRVLLGIAAVVIIAASAYGSGQRSAAATGSTGDVRLRMLICWNGGYKVPKDQYNNAVAKTIREKIGVTVEFEGIMMNEMEKLNLMFASGDMPDMVNAPFWGGTGGETGVIKKAAAEGMLLPIEDMLEKYPNVKRSYDIGGISQKMLDTELKDPSFNGHLYLIPQETAGNIDHITNWTYGVFVRGDVPKALGINERNIKTSQQLYDFMAKARDYGFKDVNGNPTIVATTYHDGWDYGRYAENFDLKKRTGYIKNTDGTVTSNTLTDTWINRNLFIWRLVNQNILDKESFKHNDSAADTKVGNGTALFFAAQYGVGINSTKLTGLYTSHPEMRYIPVGPLTYADGQPLTQIEPMGRDGTPVIFFPKTCKNLDAAFRYIDFVNTKEGKMLTAYGIQGQTYNLNAQGQPRLIASYLDRKQKGDSSWEDELREIGGFYIKDRLWYRNLDKDWFGEDGVGNADAAVQELEDYKKLRPVEQIPGITISSFETQFPNWQESQRIFEGDIEKSYRERAYFAATEAEARKILQDYQTYVKTASNGIYLKFLDYLTGIAKTRSDVIF